MTSRDWALLYGGLGWRVFPVVPGGKRPRYRGWQRDATTNPELIRRNWRAEPGPNVGIICGEKFDAFDVEADHLAALRQWADARGHRLPPTPLARTGRGGIHVLVAPTGIGRGRDLVLDGVHVGELKSTGGFIVVCPSVTLAAYRWLRSPEAHPLAPAPRWLLGLVARPRPRARAAVECPSESRAAGRQLAALASAVALAGMGRRNKLLYWAMRRAEEEGIATLDAARTLARSAIEAGLDEREVRSTLRSALAGARR